MKSRELQKYKESTRGPSVPVHHCRKWIVAKVYRYIIKVYLYTCMGIARFDKYFELNVRALLSTNQNGKITLEGGIKGRGMKEEAAFDV